MKRIIKAVLKKLFGPIYRRWLMILNRLDKLDWILNRLDKLDWLLERVDYIINKLSLSNDIVELKDARFWVPNAPRDFTQNTQLSTQNFQEIEILKSLDKYFNKNSVVLDIGANVGNHSVYWGRVLKVKRIYSFEPIKTTFKILAKNIEINNLSDKVKIYNVGLSDKMIRGKINEYNLRDSGCTSIINADDGDLELNKLDNFIEIFEEPEVSFVKIDVERFEKNVLLGAVNFFQRYKPVVFIESYQGENQYDFVCDYFKKLNYDEPIKFPDNNYLFIKGNL
jgi:FkbM family methyltransferase